MHTPYVFLCQFRVTPGEMITMINGISYPAGYNIVNLVTDNPQYWFQTGVMGNRTLTTAVTNAMNDIIITTTTGNFMGEIQTKPIA